MIQVLYKSKFSDYNNLASKGFAYMRHTFLYVLFFLSLSHFFESNARSAVRMENFDNNRAITDPVGPTVGPVTGSTTFCVGGGLNLSVVATANNGGALTYKWQKNKVDIYGATFSSFAIVNVGLSDAGSYRIIVSEAGNGETISNVVTVTVNGIPNVTLNSIDAVAPGTTSVNVAYSNIQNAPNEYSIDWDGNANNAGIVDVAWTTLPSGSITITGIPVSVGSYSGNFFVRNTTTGCVSPGGTLCGTTNENGTITLTTPGGEPFTDVKFASYGTFTGNTCGFFNYSGCNASNTMSIVRGLAIGNPTFSVGANNGTFGDPCGGTVKRMAVEAVFGLGLSIIVTNQNIPPVISTNTVILPGLAEDVLSADNTGILVSDLLSGTVTDANNNTIGVAVTFRDHDNGTWQFYENDVWWNFDRHAEASATQSLLLSPTTKIRFIPATNYNGTATFTYRAWDQTTGTDHNIANTTVNGGTTAFSSTTGTASISISSINDAPIINSVIGVPTIAFDGANDHISFPNPGIGGNFTVEAWINVAQHQTWSRIADMANGAGINNIVFGFQGGGNSLFTNTTVGNGGGLGNMGAPSAFPTGVWKHVAYVNDGAGTGYIYEDGVLVKSGAQSVAENIARTLNYFAKSNYGQDAYFRGAMRDLRVWDVARSQSEISDNMNKPLIGNENGLKVYYRTDENAGTTLTNATGKSIDGTLQNGAAWATYGAPLTTLIVIEDTDKVIPGFQMVDPDAGSNNLTLTITSTQGKIKFLTTVANGLADGEITNNNSYSLTINSTVAKINATLDGSGFIYSPDLNYNGPGKVDMGLTDNGFSGVGGVLSSTYSFNVIVSPSNDIPVITSTAVTTASIGAIYTYTVTSTDIDVTDVHTYTAPVLPSWLTINPSTGVLTGTPANGDVGVHNVTVRVNDGTVDVDQSFTITVVNNPPVVTIGQTASIDENSPNGTLVKTAVGVDPDAGTTLSNWTIVGGNTGDAFAIDPVTGVITTNNIEVLDYELIQSFTLVVTVSDGINTSAQQTIVISLNNLNDTKPIGSPNQNLSIEEHSANGAQVGIISFIDPDGPTTFKNWNIVGGNINNAFSIDPSTGNIIVNNSTTLDYLTKSTYILEIEVSDGTHTAKQFITIELTKAPVIVANQTFNIDENSEDSTVVGKVAVNGANQVTNWQITEGNTEDAFIIDPVTGVIKINNRSAIDFESNSTYTITVQGTDGVNTFVQTLTINLNDIDVEVEEGNPVIFTAFSPNRDNVNDTWNIQNLKSYPLCQVKVFNSDGIELFSNTGYTQQWDGKYKGKDMPLGTYYYVIKLNNASETIYKGHLMIIK